MPALVTATTAYISQQECKAGMVYAKGSRLYVKRGNRFNCAVGGLTTYTEIAGVVSMKPPKLARKETVEYTVLAPEPAVLAAGQEAESYWYTQKAPGTKDVQVCTAELNMIRAHYLAMVDMYDRDEFADFVIKLRNGDEWQWSGFVEAIDNTIDESKYVMTPVEFMPSGPIAFYSSQTANPPRATLPA